MKRTVWTIGLLTVAALGAVSMPAWSQEGDSAVIQESTQDNLTTGNGNFTGQYSDQLNAESGRRGEGNRGVVQRINQRSDTLGDDNTSTQESVQTTVQRDRNSRSRRSTYSR